MLRGTHTTTQATIERLERLRTTASGNPRYRAHFTNGTAATTAPDAGIGYSIGNAENIGVLVLVDTVDGQIVNVTPVSA